MKNALIEKGIKKSQICVTGIPINPVFWNTLTNQEIDETYNEFQIPKNKKNFIFFERPLLCLPNALKNCEKKQA